MHRVHYLYLVLILCDNFFCPFCSNECGLFALLNATDWNGSQLPNYDPKEVLNIRKKLAYDWVTSVHNTAPWRKLLRYDKE